MDRIRINLYDLLLSISDAIDFVTPELSNHHQQVAYLAFRLAEQMGLSREKQRNVIIEGLLHDIGALSIDERLNLIEDEADILNGHAFRGGKLLEECIVFLPYAEAIKYHHIPWNYGDGKRWNDKDIPIESHILHLADRFSVLIEPNKDILSQIPHLISKVKQVEDSQFMPNAMKALIQLSGKEYIWLELIDKAPISCISEITAYGVLDLEIDDIICISQMLSRLIDFRSHSTATHTAGVAKVAEKLGEFAGFSKNECKMLLIAGYLHDLGKLAIDDTLLEKPSNLNKKEYNIIRSHTFYTYQLLDKIAGFETINKWASYHHEKLNGNGYPFHLKEESIPLGSRIMAVADIFTAITENRPYRKGMSKDEVVNVLQSMVEDGSISKIVVSLLLDNFELLTTICEDCQQQASEELRHFFSEDLRIKEYI